MTTKVQCNGNQNILCTDATCPSCCPRLACFTLSLSNCDYDDSAHGLASPYLPLPGMAWPDDNELTMGWTIPLPGGSWNYVALADVASCLRKRAYFYAQVAHAQAWQDSMSLLSMTDRRQGDRRISQAG